MSVMDMIANIRTLAYGDGDGLSGRRGQEAEEKARTLKTLRVVEHFRQNLSWRDEIEAESEAGRAQFARGVELYAADMADQGKSIGDYAVDPSKNPLLLKVAEKYVGLLAAEFGLRDSPAGDLRVSLGDVLCAVNDRITRLLSVLRERYQAEGLPAGAKNLRGQIAEAAREVWITGKAYRDVRDQFRQMGGAMSPIGAEMESEVLAKFDAFQASEAVVQALQRRLFVEWGVQ